MKGMIAVYREKLKGLHEKAHLLHPKETFKWYKEIKEKKRAKEDADAQLRITGVHAIGANTGDPSALFKFKQMLTEFHGHLQHLKKYHAQTKAGHEGRPLVSKGDSEVVVGAEVGAPDLTFVADIKDEVTKS